MRLRGDDGQLVELSVVGYQFPDLEQFAHSANWDPDSDANWLVIRGAVHQRRRSWSFEDPCLLTDEAAELGGWLRGVAGGTIGPARRLGTRPGSLDFLEPNLAVKFAPGRREGGLTLVWYFAAEAAPPGTADSVRYGTGHTVRLEVSALELRQAADEWDEGLRQFPDRAP